MINPNAPATLDPLFQLSAMCAADTRPEKLDLILGVYRDDAGASPVMAAVHEAEERLVERRGSKEYVGLSGDRAFNEAMTRLVLDDDALVARATTVQTVAGSGALRMLAEFLKATGPERTVHLGVPAYVNHPGILRAAGLNVSEYPLRRDGKLDRDAVLGAVSGAARGDVLLVQGCCHNPTGLTMPFDLWEELAAICGERGVVPFVDHAYFGLGEGLDEDFAGMRHLLSAVPEAVVAVSASKAWSLYSERTGCAMVLTAPDADPREPALVRSALEMIGREAYSQPPAHGAEVVVEILGDDALRGMWREELDSMRERLTGLRTSLIAHLDEAFGGASGDASAGSPSKASDEAAGDDARVASFDVDSLRAQQGMFLCLPLDADQMERLRVEHGIYGIPSGRINLAGVPQNRVADVAAAIVDVVRH